MSDMYKLGIVLLVSIAFGLVSCDIAPGQPIEFTAETDTLAVAPFEGTPRTTIQVRSQLDSAVECRLDLLDGAKSLSLDRITIPKGYRGELAIYIPFMQNQIDGKQLKIEPIGDSLPSTTFELRYNDQ